MLIHMEEYKQHPELSILVSNYGNVKGPSGLILKGTKALYHRIQAKITNSKVSKTFAVHRLVVETFIGKIPEKMVVNHKDGNKFNNNLTNLEIVSSKENNKHAIENGFRKLPKGENCWNASLKDNQIIEIYNLIKEGNNNNDIADIYGISDRHVHSIRVGHRWNHLFQVHLGEFLKSSGLKNDNIKNCLKILDTIVNNSDKTNVQLSKITGLEVSMISRIKNKKSWKKVWNFYNRRATTIPKGSTLQANGNGKAESPTVK